MLGLDFYRKVLIFGSFLLLGFFLSVSSAKASNLFISPASGSYLVGQNITVGIYVSTDQEMNAASGIVSFPADKLDVISISKSGSVFNLWVKEPSVCEGNSGVCFEGIVLNPGYSGKAGKILSIIFKTKSIGNAPVIFSSGSILANDGQGTNILQGFGNANYAIQILSDDKPLESTTPTVQAGTISGPQISSNTHSEPDNWYADSNPSFTWKLAAGVTGVSVGISKQTYTDPGFQSDGIITSKSYQNLDDGIWYFSVKLRNKNGWGSISHYRFQIDSQKPTSFIIEELPREDMTNPLVKFKFIATDELATIKHFLIKIDGQEVADEIWNDEGEIIFTTPVMVPGNHMMIAQAIDPAGNFLANSVEFLVDPIASPKITDFSDSMHSRDYLVIRGIAVPESEIYLYLSDKAGKTTQQVLASDENGNFIIVYDGKLKDGLYKFWLTSKDQRGAQSLPTKKYTVVVQPSGIIRFGNQALDVLTVLIPFIALIIVLMLMIWYGWYRFIDLRKRLSREVKQTEYNVHQALEELRKDVKLQLNVLKRTSTKKKTTKEQEKMLKELKKSMDNVAFDIEKYISREFQDIEKYIKDKSLVKKDEYEK